MEVRGVPAADGCEGGDVHARGRGGRHRPGELCLPPLAAEARVAIRGGESVAIAGQAANASAAGTFG